jgi:hypothetical protein
VSDKDWQHRMDKEWTDLFWKHCVYHRDMDKYFMQFFRSIGMFSIAQKIDISSERLSREDAQKIKHFNDGDYISVIEYENWSCFESSTLETCFHLLDYLSDATDQTVHFNRFVFPKNYTDRVLAYAYLLFVSGMALTDVSGNDLINLNVWLRITGNLVRNTNIDDTTSFVRSIQSLSAIWSKIKEKQSDCKDWVLSAFAAMTNNDIVFFGLDQRKEEVLKANLIKEDSGWEEDIIIAENHPYFYGQIGFLLEYAFHDSKYDRHLFNRYARKAHVIFDDKLLAHPEHLVERALITKGDYLVPIGPLKKSFCKHDHGTLRSRDENWRQVFKAPERSNLSKTTSG